MMIKSLEFIECGLITEIRKKYSIIVISANEEINKYIQGNQIKIILNYNTIMEYPLPPWTMKIEKIK